MKKLTHIPLERGEVRVGESPRLGAVGIIVLSSLLALLSSLVPPRVPPSSISRSRELEPPTSLWKGEGLVWLDFVHLCWLGAMVIKPTSLNRGEGLFGGQLLWLRAN
jgi:hypothetical protein